MTALFLSEVRRDLSRRLVWVLLLLALVATAIAGAIAFVNAQGTEHVGPTDVRRCFQQPDGHADVLPPLLRVLDFPLDIQRSPVTDLLQLPDERLTYQARSVTESTTSKLRVR